jgi:non-heme chloroperoxidase
MPYMTADDGAQIFYKGWGTEGSPVILSHGWPLNADAWEAAALFLANNCHRAIAHDRRGHGRSSQTWHGNEMLSATLGMLAMLPVVFGVARYTMVSR